MFDNLSSANAAADAIIICGVCCGMRMLDVDGLYVGDGSVVNVRIKMNVNVNPYSF